MSTKLKDNDTLAFLGRYTVADVQAAISVAVADLAYEYDVLHRAKLEPRPIPDQASGLLGITGVKGLTTVDLARWRIAYWEAAQDRLWDGYRHLTGQAPAPRRAWYSFLG